MLESSANIISKVVALNTLTKPIKALPHFNPEKLTSDNPEKI